MLVREVPGARRFAPDGSARAEDRFAIGKNDAAYGLGQFRDGRLNLRGTRRDLLQENKKAVSLTKAGAKVGNQVFAEFLLS
jgi:hypothetical protein